MGLFNRFRPQPRWKHADPAVRLVAVEEIPLEEQALLRAIATSDGAPGVRVAAIRKVIDPQVLADVARSDGSPEVRDAAGQVLVDTAIGVFEGSSEAECLAALAVIEDPKLLGAVAMAAAEEPVRRAALERLTDGRVLGSVARRATHGGTRLEALARLHEEGEIAAVALRGEFKDVSQAAVDRLSLRGSLDQVAEKAKNRSAAKRARARLREIDEAAAREAAAAEAAKRAAESAAAAARAREAALLRQAEALCESVEQLAASSEVSSMAARLATAEAAWPAAAGQAGASALGRRFEAAVDAVRARLVQSEAERQQLAEREHQILAALAARDAICERAERLAEQEEPEPATAVEAAWSALPAMPPGAEGRDTALVRRFEAAVARLSDRERLRLEIEQRAAKAEALAREFEALAAAPFSAVRGRLSALRRAWADLTATGPAAAGTVAERVATAEGALRAAETAARDAEAARQRELVAALEGLCAEAEAMANASSITLKDGERVLKDLRGAVEDAGPPSSREDRARLHARLKAAHAGLAPRVRELRELDDWQRWANAGVQEELCRRAEALKETAAGDPAEAARQLAELQSRWKSVASAPRDQGQVLWQRFRVAADEVRASCDGFFAAQAQERAANLERKTAICQQAEALAESTDWLKTADEIKRLQAEWKAIGPVPRGHEKPLWERFRAACDRFFTRRHEDLAERKAAWAANLARKEALVAEAETLAESSDWDATAGQLKRLQADWKTIGPVRKNKSELVWQRFRSACDRFFERYQNRHTAQAGAQLAEREALAAELEALLAPGERGDPPDDLVSRVHAAWERRQAVAARGGVPRQQAEALDARARSAVTALAARYPERFEGTDFDLDANRRRLEDLCDQVERLSAPEPAAASGLSVSTLAQQLREALASNTMTGRTAGDAVGRHRQMAEAVRKAQAAWTQVGPVPADVAESLAQRFHRACQQVLQISEPGPRGSDGGSRPWPPGATAHRPTARPS